MASHQNLKNEKANAMRKFHFKRFLETLLHLFNISATLFLFSQSTWFPIAVHAFRQLHHVSMLLLHNSFFVFVLINAIILFLYALSDKNAAAYSEIECHRSSTPEEAKNDRAESTAEKEPETPPPCGLGTGEPLSPVLEETVTAVTETTTTTTSCTTVNGGDQEVSEKKCYRRVQSERRMVVDPPPWRELKRSSTALKSKMRYVDHLSKEEFNRTVEEFIAMQKKKLWEEEIGS